MLMSKLEKAKKEMGSYSAILSESGSSVSKIGDTTYTKIFVGGLAWATQRDSIKRYFEQFGDILEAVVIVDKRTGRSKGYGFVTFKDPDSATKACQNPYPVIDGRRTNCNLAAFGAQRNPPNTPQRGLGKSRHQSSTTRAPAPAPAPAISSNSFNGVSAYFYQQIPQYAFPYVAYGYPCYPQDMFTVNYYNAYGGQDFLGHYIFGSPNEVYFGCYPMVALHGEERERSGPRTNPKTTENPRHMHVSRQHYKTETGPNTAVASEPATARTTAACDQNSAA